MGLEETLLSENYYIVAGQKPWAERVYRETISRLPGHWQYVNSIERLQDALLDLRDSKRELRYIFFLHWSDKVPTEMVEEYECVNFHASDLPYGRGGSPVQNLIVAGKEGTQITAHRMTTEIDAGPVYGRAYMSLNGLAEEIYLRAMRISADMIKWIATARPEPRPQMGEVLYFKRRTPEQSAIGERLSLKQLFDHIRMLDAESYPRAYLDHAGFRYTFSRPALRNGRIEADVDIRRLEEA